MSTLTRAGTIATVLVLALQSTAAAATRLVSLTGSDWNDCTASPCRTIKHAVEVAVAGDTISVGPGEFVEDTIVVDKALTIEGSGITSTVVKSSAWEVVFRIFSAFKPDFTVTIRGLEIREAHFGVSNERTLKLEDVAVNENNIGLRNSGWIGMERVIVQGNNVSGLQNELDAVALGVESAFVNNSDTSQPHNWGGITNDGLLALHSSLVAGNVGRGAGGILSTGAMYLTNVTISGNKAVGLGAGGIAVLEGPAMLTHVTITANTGADGDAGGLLSGGDVFIKNSIVAGNDSPQCEMGGRPILDTINGGGNLAGDSSCNLWPAVSIPPGPLDAGNILNADPGLLPLADNGGPTPTHALESGSLAIDAGYAKYCLAADQRGAARPYDGDFDGVARCDIGAFEYQGAIGGGPRYDETRPYWHFRGRWLRRGPARRPHDVRREPPGGSR